MQQDIGVPTGPRVFGRRRATCHPDRLNSSGGKCSMCVRREKRASLGLPAGLVPRVPDCHPRRTHEAHGKCAECYGKTHNRRRRRKANALLAVRYGLTGRELQEMRRAQGFKCAICHQRNQTGKHGTTGRRRARRLCIDHNHQTGAVRDLLCNSCNFIVGHLEKNPDRVLECAAYIAHWK